MKLPILHDRNTTIWFVSDVHLVLGDRDYLDLFLSFLDKAANEAQELYIVGDLFEFWIGDQQASIEFYRPLFDRFQQITAKGVLVRVIHGNRDFLMGSAFTDAGCELMADELVLALEGNRVHLSHGDQFCIHDHSYLRARVVIRSKLARWVASILPGAIGHWLARRYRKISERKKAKMKVMTGNRFHTIEDGVRLEFLRGDHDTILCGHIHYYADQAMAVGDRSRRVLTTGAWEEGPNFVAWNQGELTLQRFSSRSSASP